MDIDPIYTYYTNKYPHIPDEYVERMVNKARERQREHEELELEERHLNEWNAHPLGRRNNAMHERQRHEWRELRNRGNIHQRNRIRNQHILNILENEEPEWERNILMEAQEERRGERGRNQNMIDQWDRERPANWERELEERWEAQHVQQLAAEQLNTLNRLNIDAAAYIGDLRLSHEDANAISYEDFKNGDMCVRLQQDNRFIFHIDGLKEWFRRSNLNPLTNLPVVQDDIERFRYKKRRNVNGGNKSKKGKSKNKAKKSRKFKK
jgi:hypothetical protein